MKKEWLHKGPSLSEIVAEKKDDRKDRSRKLALIIPSYNNNEILKKHIDKLSNQTFKDFDIIIVYGENDRFIQTPEWASIVHLRKYGRMGCAGAFYIGENYTLAEKYNVIIQADNDCLPESVDLLERLVDEINEKKVLLPRTFRSSAKHPEFFIHCYGGRTREILEKTGLTYLPLYIGGEELDIMWRIRKSGFQVHQIDASVSHPRVLPFVLWSAGKMYYYNRGNILQLFLAKAYFRAALLLFNQIMLAVAFFVMGKFRVSKKFLEVVWSISEMDFFRKKQYESGKTIAKLEETELAEADIIINADSEDRRANDNFESVVSLHQNIGSPWKMFIKRISCSLRYFLDIRKYFGKKVQFLEWCSFIDIAVMLMAKSSHIKIKDKKYEIIGTRSILAIVLGFFVVVIAVLPSTFLALFLTLFGLLNKKNKGITNEHYLPFDAFK
jgi:GT2 family glycosyltransferase